MANDHTLIYEVRAALELSGCPICRLAQRSLQRYLSALTNEGVTDRQQRDEIRAAYGFCAAHARVLRNGRTALGSAIIHRDLINNLSRALGDERPGTRSIRLRMQRAVRPDQPDSSAPLPARRGCLACDQVREAERRYCAALVNGLSDPATLALFRPSAGLCVPHLRLGLRLVAGPSEHELLRTAQQAIWQRLLEELDEFIRKQDHRFSREPSGPEADSWRRAIDLVSGQAECDGAG